MYSDLYLDTMKALDKILERQAANTAIMFRDNSDLAIVVRDIWRLRMQAKSEENRIESAIAASCLNIDLRD
jgi:hypothetical protein